MIKKDYRDVFLNNPANHHIIGNKNIQINGNKNIFIQNNNYFQKDNEKEIIKIKTEVKDYDPKFHLTADQQYKLSEIVNEIGDACRKYNLIIDYKLKHPNDTYRYIWGNLKRKFKVPKYSLIPQRDFDAAKKYLNIIKSKFIENLKYHNATDFKDYILPKILQIYKIKSNGKNLFDLLLFAEKVTKIKKNALEYYSKDDLYKIYKALFSRKKF
ncbi:ORF6C domain-containing protein [Campylobacter lari]|uniref:ORF6C domain-containing protein n=1 Tax=Campylobacter lari TaxID=201 RepID=UPI00127BC273|nr:ORF6C domain-containing protein [Campylobacter lari]MBT0824402.1 ORF6C domain-containing protein [Campylobacter lari]